ncbi:hypothetical protein R3W88_008638 [Solanum pinnatisectum]|uniref:RNase H type-1 domain-containing protein n=1 Tax=Solanum pinnatisectum TaxID=50273 RepID=A0AAV9M901_9SOLN|nr:hypothetical protein R3W88_008638 [Solanum pinnatisectum]
MCSKGNPRACGGGGIFKGHHGEFISAFSAPLVSTNVAESLAPCIGIEWCKENGINMVIVDLDSSLANKEADVLAKEGSELENVKCYSSYQELPKQARGICYMDKHQFVSFKIRGSNSSFIFDDNG